MIMTVKSFLFSLLLIPAFCFGQDESAGDSLQDSIKVEPFVFDYQYYKLRYKEEDLMYKITDNWGNGFDSLYGTRNMRPILHGVAYRGGANNYYHITDKRNNHNPLPNDGMKNLCAEGFSAGVYLYRENFDTLNTADTCNCVDNTTNEFQYYQKDYFDNQHVRDMVEMVYKSATEDTVGPVYLHCWNGWHASGFISAVLLKQFCGFSDFDAVNYWDLGTDGANTSPRYQTQRERIKEFQPYPEFMISDSLKSCLCPPMPENIDSSALHIEVEHLVVVPEAIPVGYQIVLYNVKFGAGKTTFSNISTNPDIVNLKLALDTDPNLTVEIGGYTDNSGNTASNITISQNRAKFVYDHLIANGYDASRLSYKGYGPKNPIYSNRYKSTREGNRRIEVKVLSKTQHSSNKLVDETPVIEVMTETPETAYLSHFLSQQKLPKNERQPLQSNFIIDSLQFASGSADLPESGIAIDYMNELIQILKKNPALKIQINGFTDASGIAEKNVLLSEERAKAVYQYFVDQGLSPNRVFYRGHGSAAPIAPNAYKWGRDLNRRIEVELVSD
ncbi:MAG: OmpA family protein [Putridiphycobacter sp.]|nr:OmpA family protein [Putridiphycobacter sp.]